MMLHGDSRSWRRHGPTKLKALLRSANTSAKQLIRSHLTSNKSTRSWPSALCVEPTPEPNPRVPESTIIPSPTFTSDATTIHPSVVTLLDPERLHARDSGVVIPPDDCFPRRDVKITLDINETPCVVRNPRCGTAIPLDPPTRTDTKASTIAVRSPGRNKDTSLPRTRLYSLMLQVLIDRELESMVMTSASRDGLGDNYWSAKEYLHCLDIPAVIRMLLPSFGVDLVTGYCDKSFSLCGLLAKAPSLQYTIQPVTLDFPPFLLDKDLPYLSPSGYSMVVGSVDGHERTPGHNNTAPQTGLKRKQSNPDPQKPEKHRRPAGKRKTGDDDDGDNKDKDGGDREPNPPGPGNSSQGDDNRLFACPFYKRDPIAHRFCLFRQTLTGTNYVKQHLSRYHQPPIHCPTCGMVFGQGGERDKHIRDQKCERKYFSHQGMTVQQQDELKRTPRNATHEERWYAIWKILFPGEPRPASPYVNDPIVEILEVVTSRWVGQGGPERMARAGITLSRASLAGGQGRGAAGEDPRVVWGDLCADLADYAGGLLRGLSVPETHVGDEQQQGQARSQVATESSWDMVPRAAVPSQERALVATPAPAHGITLPPGLMYPWAMHIDPRRQNMAAVPGGGYGNIFFGTGGAPQGSQPTQAQAQVQAQSHPAIPWTFQNAQTLPAGFPNMSINPLFSSESQGSIPEYGTPAGVDSALQGPGQAMGYGMELAPPMGQPASCLSAQGQAFLGYGAVATGGDVGGTGSQAQAGMQGGGLGQAEMPGGQGHVEIPAGGQGQGLMQADQGQAGDDRSFEEYLNRDGYGYEYGYGRRT